MNWWRAVTEASRNAVRPRFVGRVHPVNVSHRGRLSRQVRAEDLRRWRKHVLQEARR